MSAPDRGLPQPQVASRDIFAASSVSDVAERRLKRHVSGQERQLGDLIDASRVLECSQVERQVGFQRIVRQ
jgi:hypothetical protein